MATTEACNNLSPFLCYLVSAKGTPLFTDDTKALYFVISSLVCGVFWLGAYSVAVWRGFRNKVSYFPWFAVCMNLSWELLGALGLSAYTEIWVWLCRIAVFLNVFIFTTALLYGASSQPIPLKPMFRPFMVITLSFMFLIQYLLMHSLEEVKNLELGDGAVKNVGAIHEFLVRQSSLVNGYVINLLMSAMFLFWLFRMVKDSMQDWQSRSREGLDMTLAWLKMLGTAATLLLIFLLDSEALNASMSTFLMAMALACMGLDCVYIFGLSVYMSRYELRAREKGPDELVEKAA